MVIDYKKYPSNWQTEIRPRILKRANHKCEWCGVENYAVGARDVTGGWHDENDIHQMNSGWGDALFGEFPDMIKIILTIAHLDNPDPMDCRDENLAALCQRCHFGHDRESHIAKARRTRLETKYAKILATGQMRLFGDWNERV